MLLLSSDIFHHISTTQRQKEHRSYDYTYMNPRQIDGNPWAAGWDQVIDLLLYNFDIQNIWRLSDRNRKLASAVEERWVVERRSEADPVDGALLQPLDSAPSEVQVEPRQITNLEDEDVAIFDFHDKVTPTADGASSLR